MAIYIQIKKTAERAAYVTYAFGPLEKIIGTVRLNKQSGVVDLMTIIDGFNAEFYLSRVRRVLQQHHATGRYPEKAEYKA